MQSADREEERGSLPRRKTKENEAKGVQTAGMTNGRAQLPPKVAQIPLTLTQIYLTVLGAFLSLDPGKGGATDKAKTTRLPQRSISSRVLNIITCTQTRTCTEMLSLVKL